MNNQTLSQYEDLLFDEDDFSPGMGIIEPEEVQISLVDERQYFPFKQISGGRKVRPGYIFIDKEFENRLFLRACRRRGLTPYARRSFKLPSSTSSYDFAGIAAIYHGTYVTAEQSFRYEAPPCDVFVLHPNANILKHAKEMAVSLARWAAELKEGLGRRQDGSYASKTFKVPDQTKFLGTRADIIARHSSHFTAAIK